MQITSWARRTATSWTAVSVTTASEATSVLTGSMMQVAKTLDEAFDLDMSLFGNTFVTGRILANDGGVFAKRAVLDEQAANLARKPVRHFSPSVTAERTRRHRRR